jgi:PhnB protein
MSVQPIPPGSPTIIPHITVADARKAIAFYEAAFGATAGNIALTPDDRVMHAEVRIGSSMIYVNDPFGPPATPSGVTLHLWSDDVDVAWKRAVDAGAEVLMPLANQFWGDRYGHLKDPFGHTWSLAQHVEDVAPEEMSRRSEAMFSQMKG